MFDSRCNAIKYLCRVGKKDEIVQELKQKYDSLWCKIRQYELVNNITHQLGEHEED